MRLPADRLCPSCGAANSPTGAVLRRLRHAAPRATRRPRPPHGPVATPAGAAAGSSRSPRTPVAERRLVTVLFADLVGFTALSEGRDAEAVRELLSEYFELARDVIERYGGTVEKFIGDAVMAVWGAPVAHEDDAERAVRAGARARRRRAAASGRRSRPARAS